MAARSSKNGSANTAIALPPIHCTGSLRKEKRGAKR